jgi:acetyltransferase-like isoleucine patch superfamily enzyme
VKSIHNNSQFFHVNAKTAKNPNRPNLLAKIWKKIEKVFIFSARNVISPFSPRAGTRLMTSFYRKNGMRIVGQPGFIASSVWFDGTDYSLIELNEGCTVSGYVRVLTHDWSLYAVGRGMGLKMEKPIGILRPVRIGRCAFIGMGAILLPGADVGDGAIVGAGSVVRGKVPSWTIVVGSPAQPAGGSREYLFKNLERMGLTELLHEARQIMENSSKESRE